MTSSTTLSAPAISERLGITTLNPMQLFMEEHAAAPFIILCAPTGSGKTLAFSLPALLELEAPGRGVQALVIAPARELVLQIAEVMRRAAAPSGFKVSALYGGHSVREEQQTLSVSPDIVVATPGRLLDHLERGHLTLGSLRTMVLDEWDKTLELGFAEEMKKICRAATPAPAHLILTSATALDELPAFLPVKGEPLTASFMPEQTLPARAAKVEVVEVPSAVPDKLDTCADLLLAHPDEAAIVFVNHRESAERVAQSLRRKGLPVALYHGALDQWQRADALETFANGSRPILVATDLAARGLDIEGVRNVIHYHLPPSPETWTHRNGRTGRQGAPGTVYVITSEHDDLPPFITFDRRSVPAPAPDAAWHPRYASIHINAGKKDKVSKGDIVGFLTKKGGLTGSDIGRIALSDHGALVAVDAAKAQQVVEAVKPHKLKNRRVVVALAKNS